MKQLGKHKLVAGITLILIAACGQDSTTTTEPATASQETAVEPPTLKAQLEARAAESTAKATPEKRAAMENAIAELAASGINEKAIKVGDRAPDFTLPDVLGDTVTLYEQLQSGPVVLTWYRGSWCPYCNLQLRSYQQSLAEIHAAGAELLAISPELPDSSMSWQEKNELAFVVLSDVGNQAAREYGVVYRVPESIVGNYRRGGRIDLPKRNGDDSLELPLAVTYVIGADGIVHYAFLDADYRKRAETSDIVDVVVALAAQDN